MPFTPFHLGPPFLLGLIFVAYLNMAAILLASVIIDIEPVYCIATSSCPLHGPLHSYVGSSIIAIAVVTPLVFVGKKPLRALSNSLGVKQDHSYSLRSIIAGALVGGWSHVFLDSFLYADLSPFWPVSLQNPFAGLLSLSSVLVITTAGFLIGAALYFWRLRRIPREAKQGH